MIWLVIAATLAWLWLIFLRGGFHATGPELPLLRPRAAPPVCIVVPARDEAGTIEAVIAGLLAQDYGGPFRVVLVDDNSTDATAALARAIPDPARRLTVLTGAPRPSGWAGKLWAVDQGVSAGTEELVLLTDADILHEPSHLATLVAGMERTGAAMVSEMVRLNCTSFAERALVPAFVYFFCMLYPFAWVNDPRRTTAAAAGGTILIRRQALARIGGIAAIKGALIDDVALARAVKRSAPIWLGHTSEARSIRPYPDFADIWRMIARSAYVQLGFSPVLLLGTVLGMGFLFGVPVIGFLGLVDGQGPSGLHWLDQVIVLTGFFAMMVSFDAASRRYGSGQWARFLAAFCLPLIALFYLAATIGAAIDHHRGRGVVWKNRAYTEGSA
ncbi:MAG: glycosyltransferase [Alphaproteobacteria bacterium]|nr:glycosyltransferase [Alphaproteobacteria bacterium]